jgi:hypothetical protein
LSRPDWVPVVWLLHGARHKNFEGGAMADFAVDGYVSAALFHDSVNGGQAQPGPFSLLFGGKERLENTRESLPVHAATGVADGDQDVVARLGLGVEGEDQLLQG